MSSQRRKILLLVVDRDDDLGAKAKVESPVVGRSANFEAAIKLLMNDPEEADANSMFAAVKMYDELKSKDELDIEIATITGSRSGGLDADLKISERLERVLSICPASECIVISDGPVEQSLLSIISSRIKINAIKYVVVKQSQSLEQTWFLIGKYLRMAFSEPYYAKYMLGVPGIVLLVVGSLYMLNLLNIPILLAAIGLLFILRGFSLDVTILNLAKRLYGLASRPIAHQVRIFTTLASVIIIISAINLALGEVSDYISVSFPNAPTFSESPEFWLSKTGVLIGVFLSSSVDLLLVAALLTTFYNIFYYFYIRSAKIWRMSQAVVILAFIWALLRTLAEFLKTSDPTFLLQLVIISIVGFATLATSLVLIRTLRRRASEYFKRR